ncbi:MAG: hypothetical protein HQL22_04990 [Candidatus Omnitrophica bacterium]|nr:hypothetical protein [Candidatus Omnitrophota bacterium]
MTKFYLSCLIFSLLFVPGPVLYAAQGQDDDAGFILPEYSKRITIDLKDASLKDILKIFSKQMGANFIFEKNVPDDKITVLLNDVPVEQALKKVLASCELTFTFDRDMNLITIMKIDKDKEAASNLITRVYPLKYASLDSSKVKTGGGSFSASLQTVLSPKGKLVDETRTNSIIVTDVKEQFPEIERMLAKLDVPIRQVLIQMELLDVSKTTLDTLGSKINFAALVNSTNKNLDYPWRSSHVTGVNLNLTSTDKTSGDMIENSSGSLNFANSALILDFLKQDALTKTLSRPRVITADNQTATIQITTNQVIGGTTVMASGSTPSSITLERSSTGVQLTVTPQINPVTNEILLSVEPKATDAGGPKSITINGIVTTYRDPEERSVKVTLLVPNGKTVVIGGLLRRTDSSAHSSVPFLSKIPLLGFFFKHKSDQNDERELMVFLTPRVLGADELVPGELKKIEDRNLKMREQSFPDMRSGLIDKEMDAVKRFRKEE